MQFDLRRGAIIDRREVRNVTIAWQDIPSIGDPNHGLGRYQQQRQLDGKRVATSRDHFFTEHAFKRYEGPEAESLGTEVGIAFICFCASSPVSAGNCFSVDMSFFKRFSD